MTGKNSKYHIQANILASKIPKKIRQSAYGYSLSDGIFVGLPASNMKGKWVQLTIHPSERPCAVVPVGHIGPWNGGGWDHKFDDPYWRHKKRPQAETGRDLRKKITDKSGIQISHRMWELLNLSGKKRIRVNWHFVVAPRHKKAIIVSDNSRKSYRP